MNAVWYERKGTAREVLCYGEMEVPPVGPEEVLVRVHVSGVNPSDIKARSGYGGNIAMPFPRIVPHQDGAGVIEAVGDNVPKSRIGARVWLYEAAWQRPYGTAAEYTVVPGEKAVPLPDNVDFTEGACLGVPVMTAHRCLFADGPIQSRTVLITGGAGAVGMSAIQLARWGGTTVITTIGNPEQAEIARAAGADYILNYKTDDIPGRIQEITGAPEGRGIDLIVEVDLAGNLALAARVLKPYGVLSTYASSGAADVEIPLPFNRFLLNGLTLRFVYVYRMPKSAHEAAVRDISACLAADKMHHVIARRFALENTAEAHEAQENAKEPGKVLVDVL